MKYLQKYVDEKDRKIIIYLLMLAAAGALLMLWGRVERRPATQPQSYECHTPVPIPAFNHHRPERALEEELEEFLSLVAGAGSVRVMVSKPQGRETVFAVDSTTNRSYTLEEDSQGGSRDHRQFSSTDQTVVITDRNGIDQPLILREIEARIEGIVIIAQGGDDPFVVDALTRAAMAVLGVEAHKIQVLVMAS